MGMKRWLEGVIKDAVRAAISDYRHEDLVPLSIRKLDVGPDDILLITFPGRLTQMQAERVREIWSRKFPEIKVAVLESGADFAVVAKKVLEAELGRPN